MSPLSGRRILVTRTQEQAAPLAEALRRLGADVVESAVIAIEDPEEWEAADAAIRTLERYDWVVFTSANAVERFLRRMETVGQPAACLRNRRCAAIGDATARRLARHGVGPVLTPEEHRGEGLAERLIEEGVRGRRILIPRALVGRRALQRLLEEAGAHVDIVPVYRTVPRPLLPDVARDLHEGRIHVVTFTSPSTVTHLIAGLVSSGGGEGPGSPGGSEMLRGVGLAAIGPVTAQALRDAGLTPTIVAETQTVEGLVRAIVAGLSG